MIATRAAARRPTTTAIDHFAARFPGWDRGFAVDVIRETRRAARDFEHFRYLTGLKDGDAVVLWTSGRIASQELAA